MQQHNIHPALLLAALVPSCGLFDADDEPDPDEPGVLCAETIVVEEAVTTPTVWSSNGNADCADVQVEYAVEVQSSLEIEPGTTVVFAESAGLKVAGDGASLSAVGTPEEPIVFTGSVDAPGHWEALVFETGNPDNALENVEIAYGGRGESFGFSGNTPSSLIVRAGGAVSIVDSRLSSSAIHGMYLADDATLTDFSGVTFEQNGGSPISLPSEHLTLLSDDAVFEENTDAWVSVRGGSITTPGEWPAMALPLRFEGYHYIDLADDLEAVSVAPGATLRFLESSGIRVDRGGFDVSGTDSDPVVLEGTQAVPGHWQGVVYASASPDNRLDYATVSDAGRGDSFGFSGNSMMNVLVTNDGSLSITNSTLTGSAGSGLYLYEDAILSSFQSNAFADNGTEPVRLHTHQVSWMDTATDFDGDTLESLDTSAMVRVEADTVTAAATWSALDVPLHLVGKHYVDMTSATDQLTISPAVEIRFADAAGLRVDSGALSAVGTPSDPVTFTGLVETPGYWEAIVFASNNPGNQLNDAIVSFGGAGDSFGFSGSTETLVLVTDNAQASVTDTVLSDSAGSCFAGEGTLSRSGNSLTNCI